MGLPDIDDSGGGGSTLGNNNDWTGFVDCGKHNFTTSPDLSMKLKIQEMEISRYLPISQCDFSLLLKIVVFSKSFRYKINCRQDEAFALSFFQLCGDVCKHGIVL